MQSPDTKAIGDALGFGSAFLFSLVFGTFFSSLSHVLLPYVSVDDVLLQFICCFFMYTT